MFFLSLIWHPISPHPCLPQYLLLIQFHMSYTWISYIIAVCFPPNITILEQQVLQEEGQFVLTPDRGPVLGSDPRCWMCSDRLLCRPRSVIFHGMLLPDERTWRVCLLDWNCIKENERRKENEPGCHWSENCSMAAWLETDERVNLIWQHTTMSNDCKASHSVPCLRVVSLFNFFFFLPWSMALFAVPPLLHSALFASIVCAAACCLPSVCA